MTPDERKIQGERKQQAEIDSRRITDSKIDVLFNSINALRQQFVYYILAIDAACIAFAISATQKSIIDDFLIPLVIAVFCWVLSFLFGILQLYTLENQITSNMASLRAYIINFNHPRIKDFDNETTRSLVLREKYRKVQMFFFIAGTLAFLFWHTLTLVNNTKQFKKEHPTLLKKP